MARKRLYSFLMIYLYVKIHNVTNLKYLGKTTKDPYKYSGSGKRWLNHIKLHGDDCRTQILLVSLSKQEIAETGVFFSRLWGVVKSDEWANLIEESGSGGDTSQHIDYSSMSYWHLRRGSGHQRNTKPASDASRAPVAILHKKKTFENIQHQRGSTNSQYGTMWITNGEKNKKIQKDVDLIPKGWYKGRTM